MAYDWKRQPLATSPWRSQVVPLIPSILIHRAKAGRNITYGELAQALFEVHGLEPKARKTLYGPAVGAVGLALRDLGKKWGEAIPPLNVIVVQANSGLPGEGGDELARDYFRDSGTSLPSNRRAYIEAAMQAVYDYGSRWDRVAKALGVSQLAPSADGPNGTGVIELPVLPAAYGPESPEHKALRAWACANPEKFMEFGRYARGLTEHRLSSGDRVDAYFSNGVESLAVEVKASHASDAELLRGIYQCIKYRAVLRAEHVALRKPALCNAVLVCTRPLPKEAKALAKRLYVDFLLAPSSAERWTRDPLE